MSLKTTIKTVVIGAFGGGVASSIAALSDPTKYSFPKDLGTGKMWPFFLTGAGLAIGGLFLKSPVGQKVVLSVKESQEQIEQSKRDIQKTKDDLQMSKKIDNK
jgi:hypothetical protein